MPKFSLVIPTLRRADTFRHAISTLIDQTCRDLEIVVQNNGRDHETEAVVQGLADPRVRYFASDSILTMTENWEAALANTRGDFITFIGDDDGLFPDACELAAEIIDRTGLEIVSWRPFCYYWPTYLHSELRNRLIAVVDYDFHVQIISSDRQLGRFYRFAIDYSHLPMIYNSFVRRSVVELAKEGIGRYFLGVAPDVTSGIVNAAHTSEYAVVSRPLSMTGLSHHSNGHTAFLSARGQSKSQMDREITASSFDERLVAANNLQIFIANEMLVVRDRILSDRHIDVDFRRLIEFVAAAINDRPGFYRETLAAIETLARRHRVDLADIAIPAPVDKRPALECGRHIVGPGHLRVVIDGDAIRLQTIADAIRLMTQFVPSAEEAGNIEIRQALCRGRAPVRIEDAVSFAINGNGLAGLDDGWGEPEAWGTWSVSKRASLMLSVESPSNAALCAELKYRSFVHESHPRLDIVCRIQGKSIGTWRCDEATSSGVQRLTVPSNIIPTDGVLDLEFLISTPRSPAELGLSSDTRQLGLGIESLRLTTMMA